MKERSALHGVESVDLSVLNDRDQDFLYDDDEIYQEDKPIPDYNSADSDIKAKRAWEVIKWRKPKRAWEMLNNFKGGIEAWRGTGKRSEENMIDVPVQQAGSEPWMIDDIGYDSTEYETGNYDTEDFEKKSWTDTRGFVRCKCCIRAQASKCCKTCKALTTFKRDFNGDNATLRSFACKCCRSIRLQIDNCCTVCNMIS